MSGNWIGFTNKKGIFDVDGWITADSFWLQRVLFSRSVKHFAAFGNFGLQKMMLGIFSQVLILNDSLPNENCTLWTYWKKFGQFAVRKIFIVLTITSTNTLFLEFSHYQFFVAMIQTENLGNEQILQLELLRKNFRIAAGSFAEQQVCFLQKI